MIGTYKNNYKYVRGDVKMPRRFKTAGDKAIPITTTISHTLWEKAQKNKIVWSEALRRGVTSILAEKGDEDYLNPLQLQRKIAAMAAKLEELSQENENLRSVQK